MGIAIITGASSGIGSQFARELCKTCGINEFWFVARRKERMEELRDELGVSCKIITADLTLPEGVEKIREELEREKPEVSYLVNAAGFGNFGRFDELPEIVQKAVGSPSMLRHWGMCDSEDVNTVIMSNFQRAYKAELSRKEFVESVPAALSDMIKGLAEKVSPRM